MKTGPIEHAVVRPDCQDHGGSNIHPTTTITSQLPAPNHFPPVAPIVYDPKSKRQVYKRFENGVEVKRGPKPKQDPKAKEEQERLKKGQKRQQKEEQARQKKEEQERLKRLRKTLASAAQFVQPAPPSAAAAASSPRKKKKGGVGRPAGIYPKTGGRTEGTPNVNPAWCLNPKYGKQRAYIKRLTRENNRLKAIVADMEYKINNPSIALETVLKTNLHNGNEKAVPLVQPIQRTIAS